MVNDQQGPTGRGRQVRINSGPWLQVKRLAGAADLQGERPVKVEQLTGWGFVRWPEREARQVGD